MNRNQPNVEISTIILMASGLCIINLMTPWWSLTPKVRPAVSTFRLGEVETCSELEFVMYILEPETNISYLGKRKIIFKMPLQRGYVSSQDGYFFNSFKGCHKFHYPPLIQCQCNKTTFRMRAETTKNNVLQLVRQGWWNRMIADWCNTT